MKTVYPSSTHENLPLKRSFCRSRGLTGSKLIRFGLHTPFWPERAFYSMALNISFVPFSLSA